MRRAVLLAWILAGSAFAAQTVEGRVVNAVTGASIPGVRVNLQGGGSDYSAVTDVQGRFRIDGVSEGAYAPRYHAKDFRDIPGFLEIAGQPTLQVTAGAGPLRLDVKMQPLPKLSGRVLDPTGKPVPNATVFVLGTVSGCSEPKCFPVQTQVRSGAEGDYSIADLDLPGPWVVSATPPSSWREPPKSDGDRRLGWTQTFYPHAAEPQAAAIVHVQDGGELGNLDVELVTVEVHRLRGRVLDPRGEPAAAVAVTLRNGFGLTVDRVTDSDGVFEFDSVAAGPWRVSARLDRDNVKLWTAQSVQVQDRDVENVELHLTAPFTLRGEIVFDAPEGVPIPDEDLPNTVAGHTAGEFGGDPTCPGFPIGHANEARAFTIQVYPGPHHVYIVEPAPGQFYLDSVRLGANDVMASDPVILTDTQPLTITYKFGGGSVQGSIEGCNGGRVLLIPQEPAMRRHEFLRETTCGANGQFQFSAVRPGEYYGFAVSADSSPRWYAAWQDGSMISRAGKLTVRANEHTTAEIRLTRW